MLWEPSNALWNRLYARKYERPRGDIRNAFVSCYEVVAKAWLGIQRYVSTRLVGYLDLANSLQHQLPLSGCNQSRLLASQVKPAIDSHDEHCFLVWIGMIDLLP